MSPSMGSRLGPYEIVSAIGAGGMGEVYRARDTKLGRDVALKVLPEAFSSDAQRMARFRREAQVLASLNQPNIASIYGFEDSGSRHALVMELVEGPTLADRIKTGPIPVEEALPIAKQIAEGLEYAHERGIVHRDLKPSNIKLATNDAVKILDFGLAKALVGDISATDISSSPTISRMATQAGIILGTAAYMSPEQAKGKAVDRRTDIWSFGCVLYEMLTGKRPFDGETVTETLAAVIRAEPDWSQLPTATPPSVRNLLARCLKKDQKQRLRDIGDARIGIEEVVSGADLDSVSTGPAAATSPQWFRVLPWALAGTLALVLAAALVIVSLTTREPTAAVVISQIDAPPNTVFALGDGYSGSPALSPDGKRLVFVATGADGVQKLWIRPLDSPTAQVIEGTGGAEFPFWSPDGRSLGFFANRKLYRIDLSGGSPFALAGAPFGRGGTWGPDGTILFSPNHIGPLFRVQATGGTARPVTQISASRRDFSHRWPQFLPDGKHFLFYVWSADIQKSSVYVGSLDGGGPKFVLQNDSTALYAPPGYLLFVRQGTLMAQRFNPSSLQLSGDVQPLTTGASVSLMPSTFIAPVTVSENRVLVYGTGTPYGLLRLLWFDRSGKQVGEIGEPGYYETPRISPRGDKLAVSVGDPQSPGEIWVFDLTSGLKRRINFSNSFNVAPQWSADEKTLAFVSNRSGTKPQLYQKPANGTGTAIPLFADKLLEQSAANAEWTSDGRYLVFGSLDMETVFAMPLYGDRKPFPVLRGVHNGPQFAVSPDGKWLAYVGRGEVDVIPFPRGSGRWQVSTKGGYSPRWRGDSKELFYVSPDFHVMAAEVSGEGGTFRVGKVVPLFKLGSMSGQDVSPDGKKFVIISRGGQQAGHALALVTNWPALLKKQ